MSKYIPGRLYFPGLFTDASNNIRFFAFLAFSVFHFLVVGTVR